MNGLTWAFGRICVSLLDDMPVLSDERFTSVQADPLQRSALSILSCTIARTAEDLLVIFPFPIRWSRYRISFSSSFTVTGLRVMNIR